MGRPRECYVRLEPYFLNNQIFFLGGFGDLNSPDKLKNALYGIYRFLCLFSVTIIFSIQLVNIYLLLDNLEKLAEDISAIFLCIVTCFKLYVFVFRAELIDDLKSEFMNFRMSRTHPEEEMIYEKASWTIHAITKAFYLMGASCVIFWIFFPALDSTNERALPYPWIFPVDQYQSPYYEIIYVFQSFSLFSFLINIVSVDLGYSAFVILIIAEIDCLCRDMRQISLPYDKVYMKWDLKRMSKDTLKAMKEVINCHITIFRHVQKLKKAHGDFLFLQMSLTAIMIAMVVTDTILNSRGLNLKLMQRILYTVSIFFDTWLLCFWGSRLQGKGEDFAQEVYNVSWVKMDVKCRKALLMILIRAQRPPKLINGMLCFELPLFLKIMQLSYNAAALFKNSK